MGVSFPHSGVGGAPGTFAAPLYHALNAVKLAGGVCHPSTGAGTGVRGAAMPAVNGGTGNGSDTGKSIPKSGTIPEDGSSSGVKVSRFRRGALESIAPGRCGLYPYAILISVVPRKATQEEVCHLYQHRVVRQRNPGKAA